MFITAGSNNNPKESKHEIQLEDNSSTSDDEEWDSVAVEAADPYENVHVDHNDNSEDNTNSSELTLPDEDYNIDQDDKPNTDEFTIN